MAIAARCALVTVVFAAAAACSTSSSDDATESAPWNAGPHAKRYDDIEVARVTVPPSGGVVRADRLVITIPPGALNAPTAIIVKTVSLFGEPVLPGTLAGHIYRLEPEGLRFAVPVTVAVEPEPRILPANPRGALVLFSSPSRRSQWVPEGAATVADRVLTAQTDHFSDWAPVLVAPAGCLEPSCGVEPGAAEGAVDCRVPAAGNGVRCTGNAPPYMCSCEGQPDILLATAAPPTQEVLSVFAFACGADCGRGASDASTDGMMDGTTGDATSDASTEASTDADVDVADAGNDG